MSTCIYMALLDSCTSKASLFFRCFLLSLSFSLSLLSSSSLSSLRMWSSNVISWSSLSITVCSRREERGGREEWKEGGGGVRRRGGRREREGERWSLLHILTSLSLSPPPPDPPDTKTYNHTYSIYHLHVYLAIRHLSGKPCS